jgi:hypothetical protein
LDAHCVRARVVGVSERILINRLLLSIIFAVAFCVPFFFVFVAVFSFVIGLALLIFSGNQQLFLEAFQLFINGGWQLLLPTAGGCVGLWAASQLFCRIWSPELGISSPKLLLIYLVLGCAALAIFLFYSVSSLPNFMFISSLASVPVTLQLVFMNRGYLFNAH